MRILLFLFIFLSLNLQAQELQNNVLSFEEYMAYVKAYHPITKQAGLRVSIGEAALLEARGGFDPKIDIDYDRKEFRGTEYYDVLNAAFKIPVWFGIDLKAGFEQNTGEYLNPQNYVPQEGLYSAGISLDVGQGFFINKRMAALRGARAFRDQTVAEQELLVNQVLYEAALAYFDWLRVYNEMEIYEGFLETATERYAGVRQNAFLGEVAAIDTVEARIPVQNRMLELEQTRIELLKQRLEVSNFLWLQNNIPVELQPEMIPDRGLLERVDEVLSLPLAGFDVDLEEHPKIRSLRFKRRALEVERQLKAGMLLPDIKLEYNFITPEAQTLQAFNTTNYKAGVRLNFPLFLRKERGALRLAELKLQDADYDILFNERQIENKIEAVVQEIESYQMQLNLADEMTANYTMMLNAEERKFSFGESSLFLINNREIKLIEARLKQNEIYSKYLYAKARLFQSLGIFVETEED